MEKFQCCLETWCVWGFSFFFLNTFSWQVWFFLHVVKQPNEKTSLWALDMFEKALFPQLTVWLLVNLFSGDLFEHHTKQ